VKATLPVLFKHDRNGSTIAGHSAALEAGEEFFFLLAMVAKIRETPEKLDVVPKNRSVNDL
jgi:hypothetical protein